MQATDRSAQLRKGVLELAILAVLEHEELYAIEIIDRLAKHPALTASPGTIYPLLARLDKAKTVSPRWAQSASGPPRKYYRLTEVGATTLDEGARAWSSLSTAMTRILTSRATS